MTGWPNKTGFEMSSSEKWKVPAMPTICLIIPSVNRPKALEAALASVREHGQGLDDVIVVARSEDVATHEVAARHGVRVAVVTKPGLAQAMRAGATATEADVVAFMDDDAELLAGWLPRLRSAYEDPQVGAVGGRDLQKEPQGRLADPRHAGRIRWYGQVVGGHHLVTGSRRKVDHLKGVNCSFRRNLFVAYDASELVYGMGAQARNELIPCLGVKALGREIVLDPQLAVLHKPAARAEGDQRLATVAKTYEAVHNEVLAFHLARHPWRWRNSLLLLVVGYQSSPGFLRLLHGASPAAVQATWRAVRDGRRMAHRHRRDVLGQAGAKGGQGGRVV